MRGGIGREAYDAELGRLFALAAAKEPGCLTALLLAEVQLARGMLGDWASLPRADAVVAAVRAHLAGTGSASDCDAAGASLSKELRRKPKPFSNTGRALVIYQNACASLTIAEVLYQGGAEETSLYVALHLIDFTNLRTDRPKDELRREQLDRLQNALDSMAPDSLRFARDRVSLLAR